MWFLNKSDLRISWSDAANRFQEFRCESGNAISALRLEGHFKLLLQSL